MADVKSCDLCGKSPAQQVEVAIILWGIVRPDQPTATSEVLDACPECQVPAIGALVEHLKATLHEQAPFQIEMFKAAAERDAAQERFNTEVKPTLEILAQANVSTIPDALAAKRDAALKLIEEAEARRLMIFNDATKVHDTRVAAMRTAIRRPA